MSIRSEWLWLSMKPGATTSPLASILLDEGGGGGEPVTRTVELDALDTGDLMVRFFQEILFAFETHAETLPSASVEEVVPGSGEDRALLRARLSGRTFDPEREEVKLVIKAVTYHGLEVAEEPGGEWRARVIFDV